ncbi:MAG TPA: hypothetical protein VFR17_13610 [Mycobacterium sp.]|nr:hypothetical protein [Mycobacterium sp.]
MTGPFPPAPPPSPPPPPPPQPQRPARPADVDTGFWLWLAACPLMTVGYVVNALTSPAVKRTAALYPAIGLLVLVVCTVVVTFLILMRSGYRWARTVLTGGGIAAVVYAVDGLLDADERPAVAITAAVTGIVGSVLIAGGTYLLHRNDAQKFFTR